MTKMSRILVLVVAIGWFWPSAGRAQESSELLARIKAMENRIHALEAEVRVTALLYGLVGVFHYIFRKKFLLISIDPQQAEKQGLSVRFWDFLFYASFGLVVTSSVAIAGVLLVFCYLIVPSVGAMLYAERIGPRLAIGWAMGTLVSTLGIYLSLKIDLPTGATIVCTFGVVLILMAACRLFVKRASALRRKYVAGSAGF